MKRRSRKRLPHLPRPLAQRSRQSQPRRRIVRMTSQRKSLPLQPRQLQHQLQVVMTILRVQNQRKTWKMTTNRTNRKQKGLREETEERVVARTLAAKAKTAKEKVRVKTRERAKARTRAKAKERARTRAKAKASSIGSKPTIIF